MGDEAKRGRPCLQQDLVVMTSNIGALRIVRGITRELRRVNTNGSVRNHPVFVYIMDQFRRHDVTGGKHCRHEAELLYLADTYQCLLTSNRQLEELGEHYKQGERSTAEAAKAVGLQLPKPFNEA